MSRLQRALEQGQFAVTAEMAPPKGADFRPALETAQVLRGKVHSLNVTDMQSACLKASSLGLCTALRQAGFEPILQMTGRDRNRMALAADLLTAAAFGIDTVLCLTGDHPAVGDCRDAKPVYDLDSVGILELLRELEAGRDCGGNPLTGEAPRFFGGAAATPVYDPLPLQIARLKRKADAGARFLQTQAVFSAESLLPFLEGVDRAGIRVPILAGIIPLKSAGMAKFMNEHVPGIAVPQSQIDALAAEKAAGGSPARLGLAMAAELVAELRERKLCAGVHIMAIGAEKSVPGLLEMAGVHICEETAPVPRAEASSEGGNHE